MQFTDPPRRKIPENIVPMINVVFLLLVFFLMTAQIAPPDPFKITPPDTNQTTPPPEGDFTLYLGSEGKLSFAGQIMAEEATLTALQAAVETYCSNRDCGPDNLVPPLVLRADAMAPATTLAALMPRLGALGFSEIQLVTVAR